MPTLENIILVMLGLGAVAWLLFGGIHAMSSRGCGKKCGCSKKATPSSPRDTAPRE